MKKQMFNRIKNGFTHNERISGFDDYFQASVLAPLLLIDDEYHFLFEQRVEQIRQGGEICFPGGKIDCFDSSPQETALRETYEEIGCKPETVDVIGRLSSLFLPTGVLVHAYLGILSEPVNPELIAKDEVASVFTVPVSFFYKNDPEIYNCKVLIHPYLTDPETGKKHILLPAEELGLPSRYHEPWGDLDHEVYVYHTPHGMVWGLTAKIVYECMQEIRELFLRLE